MQTLVLLAWLALLIGGCWTIALWAERRERRRTAALLAHHRAHVDGAQLRAMGFGRVRDLVCEPPGPGEVA